MFLRDCQNRPKNGRMSDMNFNIKLFNKINSLVGRNRYLDALGRAGAEWVIVAMIGWVIVSLVVAFYPNHLSMLTPLLFFGAAWTLGWLINLLIGLLVREPRPHVAYPDSKLLFTPLMSWKSFPSDHAMSAWLIGFMAVVFNLPGAWGLFPLALWVSWGRVYAGVHYPFDIVGGAAVAGLVSVAAYYALVMLA